MFQQQINGVITLSLPFIFLYNIFPDVFTTFAGQIICSLAVGAYLYYCAWKGLRNLEKALQFSPSGDYKTFFNEMITQCGMNPDEIIVRYAYTAESIAMTANNTVIVDPVVCNDLAGDEQAVKVQNIFAHHIEPTLSVVMKKKIEGFRAALTPQVQRFIFKHEVGHVYHNYSQKKFVVIMLLGTLSAYSGILAALNLVAINGWVAVLAGMFTGGIFDLVFTYTSNATWKLQQEKLADVFAVKYSSREDVQAAADFFVKHQQILDENKEFHNFLNYLPSVVLSGHQHGVQRAKYLLKLSDQK